jgi:hypothetical protein
MTSLPSFASAILEAQTDAAYDEALDDAIAEIAQTDMGDHEDPDGAARDLLLHVFQQRGYDSIPPRPSERGMPEAPL